MTSGAPPDDEIVWLQQNQWHTVLRRLAGVHQLSEVAYFVALDIGTHMGESTGSASPGIRGMAKRTRRGKDTVGAAIRELESFPLLLTGHRKGARGANVYRAVAPSRLVPQEWQRPRLRKDAEPAEPDSSVPDNTSSVPQTGVSVPAWEGQNGNVNDYDSNIEIAELTEALAALRNLDNVEDPDLQQLAERKRIQLEEQLSSLTEGSGDGR